MKNILVTGALGFIGSQFVNYMSSKYPYMRFIILDILDYCASKDNIDKQSLHNTEIIIGDIANKELVTYILNKFEIDNILNFAAQTHVDNSFYNSIEFTKNNVLGTHIFLETIRIYHEKTGRIEKIIHVSTDEVYGGDDSDIAKNETSTLDTTSPYSASKAAIEFIVKSYYYSYKLPVLISRGNNVYGPGQYPEKIVPKFICHLLNNEKLTIHGEGNALRNFIHVYDTVTAFETLLFKGEINHVYNISAEHDISEFSVMDIARKLVKLFHPTKNVNDPAELNQYLEYVEDRKFNDARYFISSDKLKKLGWKPIKTNFDENLKELIEWYKGNKTRYGF